MRRRGGQIGLRRIAAPLYMAKEASLIYEKAKVYYDGSHHIAIPHTTRWLKPRRKFKEKEIVVGEDGKPAEDKLEPSVLVTEDGHILQEVFLFFMQAAPRRLRPGGRAARLPPPRWA